MKKIAALVTALLVGITGSMLWAGESDFMKESEYARILNVMAKIRRGEEVRVAAFGGSITTGYNSNPLNENSWRALTGKWFQEKASQYNATVKYLNEGVSGTDSAFGAARAQFHLTGNKVDLVLLEFAMNDQWLEPKVRQRSYEGVIRQVEDNTENAILALFVNERFGSQSSQQYEQQPICEYYHIPFVSWKDCENKEHKNNVDWNNYFDGEEGIHPSNTGHAEIAKYMTAKLDEIWNLLPENDADLPEVVKELPAPLTDCGYEYLEYFTNVNLEPLSNAGWKKSSPVHSEWVAHGNATQGWSTAQELAEITFKLKGTSVNVLFCESDNFRDCEAWAELPDGTTTKKVALRCLNPIRKGYLGWSSREIFSTEEETEIILHVVCPKRRADSQGKETNICGIIVTHNQKVQN